MAVRNYSNTAPPVALTVAVNTTATTLTVASTAGYPAAPFLLGLERGTPNEELALCTATTATTFTVQRGYDNTTAKAHALAASVEHTVGALEYREANVHVNTPHNIGNALPAPGAPGASAVGDTAATGTAVEPARADHRHARESFGNPAQSRPGDDMAQGTASSVARSDHKHARESTDEIINAVLPAGVLFDFATVSIPTGWLHCNGQAVSRTTYARLYQAVGTTYGVGNGSSTFNVPDLRGRMTLGLDNMGGPDANRIPTSDFGSTGKTLGGVGGSALVGLSISNMPSHNHGVNDPSHYHTPGGGPDWLNDYQFVIASRFSENHALYPDTGPLNGPPAPVGNAQCTFTPIYNAVTGITIQNNGGNVPHANLPPYLTVYKCIKT